MSLVARVEVVRRSLGVFAEVIGEARLREGMEAAVRLREALGERAIWNVNSTAVGGGVAEMLRPLLGYTRGAGIDARWAVIGGDPDFFCVTKRLHHALHGSRGDGATLDESARAVYEKTLAANAAELLARIRPGDLVLLHDPQTAGLAPGLIGAGAVVVWRCHIGADVPSAEAAEGWRFLEPYLADVCALVFSRPAYVPPWCDGGRVEIIPPSIDAFSAKNRALDPAAVHTILVHVGLVEGPPPASGTHAFVREDGSRGRVERRADVVRLGRAPAWDTPLVVQVSRWDPLKDMVGVMHGFARLIASDRVGRADLVLAGPNVTAVADDPEGGRVFEEVLGAWRALPHAIRNRVHLASLPTADVEENAVIVNALQRHAAVVVQKSLAEGFGLTVTEAMWKGRPVLASAVGGIQDQVRDGEDGVLLSDPTDLAVFAEALGGLLRDPDRAAQLGESARERVRERYLGVRHLLAYAELFVRLVAGGAPA